MRWKNNKASGGISGVWINESLLSAVNSKSMEGDQYKGTASSKQGTTIIGGNDAVVIQDKTTNNDSIATKKKKENANSSKNQPVCQNEDEPLYETQRRCLQITTEITSLLAMFVGFSLALVTPWFLLGIFTFPGPYSPQLTSAIWICCIVSIISIVLGSLLGNILWYYDKTISRWRFVFHCGSQKTRHRWGDCFLKPKTKDLIVEHL